METVHTDIEPAKKEKKNKSDVMTALYFFISLWFDVVQIFVCEAVAKITDM